MTSGLVGAILGQREKTHGDWVKQATMSQNLKYLLFGPAYTKGDMDLHMEEAVEMICVKLSRIFSGDPREPDHWRDIAGYATLVADVLDQTPNVRAGEFREVEETPRPKTPTMVVQP